MTDALKDEDEDVFESNSTPRPPRWGWVVRVLGSGSDKSDYHLVRVIELPGTTPDYVTPAKRGKPFPRNGATIWRCPIEARQDKKSRKWETNDNSWECDEGNYYGW